MSAGKDLARLLSILLAGAASVTVTRADPPRSADPLRSADPALVAASARACCPQLPLRITADPHQAIADTLAALPPDALMCVTGSVYVAGAARTALAGLAAALCAHGASRRRAVLHTHQLSALIGPCGAVMPPTPPHRIQIQFQIRLRAPAGRPRT